MEPVCPLDAASWGVGSLSSFRSFYPIYAQLCVDLARGEVPRWMGKSIRLMSFGDESASIRYTNLLPYCCLGVQPGCTNSWPFIQVHSGASTEEIASHHRRIESENQASLAIPNAVENGRRRKAVSPTGESLRCVEIQSTRSKGVSRPGATGWERNRCVLPSTAVEEGETAMRMEESRLEIRRRLEPQSADHGERIDCNKLHCSSSDGFPPGQQPLDCFS